MNSQGSTAIQAFVFLKTKHKVRVVIAKHGKPWWVAKDVCIVLGLDSSQTRRLADDEKGLYSIHTPGVLQKVTVINESGLYSLILASRKPEAKAFKKWVTSEVLPSIRKTGSYGHKPQQQFDPSDPVQLLKCLTEYAQQTIQLEAEKAKLETKLAALTPVVNSYKRLAAAEGSVCIQEAAKALKMRLTNLAEYMLKAG
jgi:anti-repressor protein